MALLRVKIGKKCTQEINLLPDKIYSAGRKESADIFINAEKAVSREHFILKNIEGVWNLEVLSRFGDVIFLGESVKDISLQQSCVFSVPPYEFEFILDGTKNLEEVKKGDVYDEEIERTIIGFIEYVPSIKFVDSNLNEINSITLSSGSEWTAGRDTVCEINIDDQRVSRRQFKIIKSEDNFFIQDLGSVNGTLLNNKIIPANQMVPIKSGDSIIVLENMMTFELKNPEYQSNLLKLNPVVSSTALTPYAQGTPMANHNYVGSLAMNTDMTPNGDLNSPYVDPKMLEYNFNSEQVYVEKNFENESADPEDEKAKKIRKILIAVVGLIILIVLLSELTSPTNKKNTIKKNDPFAKVNPNELSLLKQSKEIANDYYYKKSYQLAYDETQKIIKKFEELNIEYKKTKFGTEVEDLDKKSFLAIEAEKEIQEFHRKEEENRKNEELLNSVLNGCDTKLKAHPDMTNEEYDSCIASIIHINPAHPRIQSAKLKIQVALEEKNRKLAEQEVFRQNVAKLKSFYNKALRSEKEGSLIQAIEDYRLVLRQRLPDPESLKVISKNRLKELENLISSKSVKYVQEAEKLVSEKRYKDAILHLRSAQKINPIDITLEQKIATYKRELAKEIKPIWEEATIEETYGQVECAENKSCAVEKWRRIIQTDVVDGEYYHKAFTKLKKYGAQ